MSPFRIVLLGVLFYFLFKLIFGNKQEKKEQAAETGGEKKNLQDVLVEDPICKTLVPKGQALPLLMEGQKHYFCSEECRKKFTEQAKED